MKSVALGVDIGGTSTKVALVNRSGQLSHYHRFPTESSTGEVQPYLARLVQAVGDVLARAEVDLLGVGMSILGPMTRERTGPFASSNAPWLVGTDFRALIASRFGLPVVVNNDLTAHALAEYYFGASGSVSRLLCLAVGTGVGAGVISDGQAVRLWGATAGDCGRCILDPTASQVDGLGVRGSAEALCGTAAIEAMALQRYGHFQPAHEVIAAAASGDDPQATEIMAEVGTHLGHLLAIIYPIFFPARLVLTGGTTEAGPVLLDACRRRFFELIGPFLALLHRSAPAYQPDVEIVIGEIRGNSGLLGATVELFQQADIGPA